MTDKSELDAAIERLRANDYPDSHDTADGYVSETREADFYLMRDAFFAERDSAPADEAWAKSVAVNIGTYCPTYSFDETKQHLLIFGPNETVLDFGGNTPHIEIVHPTRGEVITTCRLVGIELKERP